MNRASAFRIKQADGTYSDPIVFDLDKENYDARVIAQAPATGNNPDDADYLEALFAEGRIILPAGAHYHIKRTVILPDGTDIDMNGATIEYTGPEFNANAQPPTSGSAFFNVDNPYPASASDPERSILEYNGAGNMTFKNGTFLNCAFGFLHSHDVTFENITFGEVHLNHVLQLCACKNINFLHCTFFGSEEGHDWESTEVINLDISTAGGQFIDSWFLPTLNNVNAATWDEVGCRDIVVDGCIFRPNNNSIYSDVLGYHANWMQPYQDECGDAPQPRHAHKCIVAVNNYIYGVKRNDLQYTKTTTAFKIRHMFNSVFANNVCENVEKFADIDHVRQVTITGNCILKNSNKVAKTFGTVSSWHSWGTGTVENPDPNKTNMGFMTECKNINIAGNSYGKRATITFNAADTNIYNQSTWGPNTAAYPRYSKDGATITLHGRVKPKSTITFNAEKTVMTLPEECRPATTVVWVGKGDTYAATNVSFPVLVKITNAGVLSLTPIGNNLTLTTASDIWIDGTYVT